MSKMSKLLDLWKKWSWPKRVQKESPWNSDISQMLTETQQLLNSFPEVVWLRISDHLCDNIDVINLANSSKFFRNLLHHKRVTYLFEPSFEILTKYLISKHSCNKGEVKSIVLSCRLVCRSWTDAIERLCQHEWKSNCNKLSACATSLNEFNRTSSIVGQTIGTRFHFSRSKIQDISLFMVEFGGWDFKYPHTVFGQGIHIKIDGYSGTAVSEAEYFRTLSYFLGIFGHYFYNCNINVEYCIRKIEAYLKVADILRAVPNVQNLFLSDMDGGFCNSFETFRVLDQFQLSLKYLKNTEFSNISMFLCNLIIGNAFQIKKLCFKKHFGTRCKVLGLNLVDEIDKLELLELWDCTLLEMKTLRLPIYPIKRLYLRLDPDEVNRSRFNWLELFAVISEKFGSTLYEFMLAFPYLFCETETSFIKVNIIARLHMPNVKKISLSMKNDCSLDFLLGAAKSLESVEICVDRWERVLTSETKLKRRNETLKIWGYHNKMDKSNIWKLFPRLKTVKLIELEKKVVGYRKDFYSEWRTWKWCIKRNSSSLKSNWVVQREY